MKLIFTDLSKENLKNMFSMLKEVNESTLLKSIGKHGKNKQEWNSDNMKETKEIYKE